MTRTIDRRAKWADNCSIPLSFFHSFFFSSLRRGSTIDIAACSLGNRFLNGISCLNHLNHTEDSQLLGLTVADGNRMIWTYHVYIVSVSVLQKSELNQENIAVNLHFLRLENLPCLLSLIMFVVWNETKCMCVCKYVIRLTSLLADMREKNLSSTIPKSSVSHASMSWESGRTPNHTHTPLLCCGADRADASGFHLLLYLRCAFIFWLSTDCAL